MNGDTVNRVLQLGPNPNLLFRIFGKDRKSFSALLANITNGLAHTFYHAVVIYAVENGQYKIKDSQGKKYEIPNNRCTFMQVIISLGPVKHFC